MAACRALEHQTVEWLQVGVASQSWMLSRFMRRAGRLRLHRGITGS